jgi:hypothetical protein
VPAAISGHRHPHGAKTREHHHAQEQEKRRRPFVDAAAGAMNTYDPGVEVVMTPVARLRQAATQGQGSPHGKHACAESDAARLGLPLRQRFR